MRKRKSALPVKLVPCNLMQTLAKEVEEKAKLVLLTKSNALRKVAKEKDRALEKVEDELRELAKKSASL